MGKLRTALLARQNYADEVEALIMKHLTPMRLLNRIGELMRAMRMLTPDEITELCRLCAEYGKAHRASFPERPSAPRLTPKAHTIEKHIPLIAQRFGTINSLGKTEEKRRIQSGRRRLRCADVCQIRLPASKRRSFTSRHSSTVQTSIGKRKPESASSRGSEMRRRRRRRRPLLGPNGLSFSEHFFLPLT